MSKKMFIFLAVLTALTLAYGLIGSIVTIDPAAVKSVAALGCVLGGAVGRLSADLRG